MAARTWHIRQLRPDDIDAVAALEREAYAAHGLTEGPAALRARSEASPSTCFAVEGGGTLAGYLLALPYPPDRSPDLGHTGQRVAHHSGNLHLHDLVIAPRHRGRGLARALLQRLGEAARARQHDRISLVAVAGSRAFWTTRNFRPHPDVPLPPAYGTDAVYMSAAVRLPGDGTPRIERAC
ncbi:GNAT family N-acetyltransferase [Streptomyces sp. NPDC090077]|uniref:GNAT family N-acetyltransferase n=1 Tax=Streptomyces sp. NPDC090077 TaxID=3365938 RepID=UPI003805503A